jgi:hypothetical protein
MPANKPPTHCIQIFLKTPLKEVDESGLKYWIYTKSVGLQREVLHNRTNIELYKG